MYGNFPQETGNGGIPLVFRAGSDLSRFKDYRGSAIWCGRGFSGGDGGSVASFDGLPKLFGMHFGDGGRVTFHQKFVRNATFAQAMKRGHVPPGIMVTPHATGGSRWRPWHVTRLLPGLNAPAPGTGALEVQDVGGRALVGYEGMSYAVEVDSKTLETRGEYRFGRARRPHIVSLGAACFAIAHRDASRYNYVLEHDLTKLGTRPVLRIFRLDAKLKPQYFEPAQLERCVCIHNLVATDNYVISIVVPEKIHLGRLLLHGNVLDALEMAESAETEFIVHHRHSGRLLQRFATKLRFTFNHVIHASEQGTELVIDLVRNTSPEQRLGIPRSAEDPLEMLGKATRYRIDLASEEVAQHELWDQWVEMPYVDGPREKPGYANFFTEPGKDQRWGICQIYERRIWLPDAAALVFSSPIVCDDLIMALVCDADFQNPRLVLLEGATFDVVAEAPIPGALGLVAHGGWIEHVDHRPGQRPLQVRHPLPDSFREAV
jgi:carotenoid cleavage dioxygenase-like enzyme